MRDKNTYFQEPDFFSGVGCRKGLRDKNGYFSEPTRSHSAVGPATSALTKEPLPQAIDEEGGCMVYDRLAKVGAERMEARRGGSCTTTVGQRTYPSADSSSYTGASDAATKMRARLERVRTRQREVEADARKLQVPVLSRRRLRGKQSASGAWEDHFRGQVECSVCYSG